jgi:Tfp pilus assembly protein PilX
MGARVRDERGSVLIITVIAMLIMGVLSVSFALLAGVETKIGVNYKQQAQAEALAEAGLEFARNVVRNATFGPGFTTWLGTPATRVLATDTPLGAGVYSARIDNDCVAAGVGAWFPASVQESTTCNATVDQNDTAVVTAWATAGVGKSRVRAVVSVDNPWRHVCSNSSQDNPPGYCNEAGNENGSPVINPGDPNDPNGPAAYDTLPTPVLGCSQIDPTMHGGTATTGATCGTGPQPRLFPVVQGDASVANCGTFGGITYSGYFDCALTTPCQAPDYCPPAPGNNYTRGCVRLGDPRAVTFPLLYAVAPCPADATGMVFNYYANGAALPVPRPDQMMDLDLGTVGGNGAGVMDAPNGRNIYVLTGFPRAGTLGTVEVQSATIYGTLMVEGNHDPACSGPNRDMKLKNNGTLTTKQTNSTNGQPVYGYPLALLIYDPTQAAPTANPLAPQDTCADMGSSNTLVNGMVYSGGHVEFNPISLNGTIVAFEIQTQGGNNALLTYNSTYGLSVPPPGFTGASAGGVVIIRKSFITCTSYNADSGGPTACN